MRINAKMFTNWLTPALATNTPQPDVILEIGPPPSARFAAHRTLLAAHSGYLRSAIRLEDHVIDAPIYIPNITADQFTPLLTYMYTGFLDLNIDNIFGVLLATHILHMPRALEICRAFLAHTQSEGYLGGAFLTNSLMEKMIPKHVDGVRVIRPIASKASVGGLGFIAPPTTNTLLPSQDTLFKSLGSANSDNLGDGSNVEEEKCERSPIPSTSKTEVDSVVKEHDHINEKVSARKMQKSHKRHHKVKTVRSSPIETKPPEEPVNASEDNPNKVIIDVASCDGPVRFQRVLNDGYGRIQPLKNSTIKERNRMNVNTSFHMQMARNISERQLISSTESENSQEIVVHDQLDAFSDNNNSNVSNKNNHNNNGNGSKSEEIFTCVYCKHTFKSQYCYQKHAKRHINPLSVDGELIVETTMDSTNEKDDGSQNSSSDSSGQNRTKSYGNVDRKREVRPLDMNVQYYPCKTCGSKFPSYYFVHKHRKLCHANEEN